MTGPFIPEDLEQRILEAAATSADNLMALLEEAEASLDVEQYGSLADRVLQTLSEKSSDIQGWRVRLNANGEMEEA